MRQLPVPVGQINEVNRAGRYYGFCVSTMSWSQLDYIWHTATAARYTFFPSRRCFVSCANPFALKR